MRIFHLVTDLGPTATGRRVSRIVPMLTALGLQQRVGVLRPNPILFPLDAEPLPIRSWFDLAGWRRLRQTVANYQPDCIHAWGRRAAEFLNLIHGRPRLKTFDEPESLLSRRIGRRIAVPPVVESCPAERAEVRDILGLRASDRVIVTADRFRTLSTMKFALGAFDVLKYTSPDWRLLILGDGPARAEVERYYRKLAKEDHRVSFLGVRDAQPVLAGADVAWQPRLTGGRHFMCEAQAANLPLIARQPIAGAFVALDAIAFAAKTEKLYAQTCARSTAKPPSSTPDVVAKNLIDEYQRH